MNPETLRAIEDSVTGSDTERMSFPQVVGSLGAAGVERYHADLQRAEKTFFLPDGQSIVVKTKAMSAGAGDSFDGGGVEAAIRAIQKGEIGYIEFCERILRAGCVGYIVSLAGRRAVYYGRTGETFVEPFPQH